MTGTWADQEFGAGYQDGRNLDAPIPSDNRSYCYRHSFYIGRQERLGSPVPAELARASAFAAELADGFSK